MRYGLIVGVTLAIAAALALPAHAGGFKAPAPAGGFRQTGHFTPTGGVSQAGGFKGKDGGGGHWPGHHVGQRPSVPHAPFPFRHPYRPRPFWPQRYGSVVSVYAPPVVYGSLYAAPTYADAAALYAPPAEYVPLSAYAAAPPPPAPPPSVIEYPQGRYELRGDGYWTPYAWEWVSSVPPPPSGPPPTALRPPPEPAAPPEPASRRSLYRWTDDQGVVNFTDSVDSIPEAYRGQAKRLTP